MCIGPHPAVTRYAALTPARSATLRRMGDDLFRVSHTKIRSFSDCRKQYWFRYVSGIEKPPKVESTPGIIGNGVHRAMKVVTETGEADRGAEELDTYLRMPLHESAAPGSEHYTIAFQLFAAGCAAHNSIESVDRWAERDTWVPWRSRGFTASARLDRADRFADGSFQVIDWKTGSWDMAEIADAQLDLSNVAARTTFRIPRETTVFAVSWNLRSGERRERPLRRIDAEATMRKIAALALAMQAESTFEATPGHQCNLCEWRPQCPDSEREWEE